MSLAQVIWASWNQVLDQMETLLLFVKSSYLEFWSYPHPKYRDRKKERVIPYSNTKALFPRDGEMDAEGANTMGAATSTDPLQCILHTSESMLI